MWCLPLGSVLLFSTRNNGDLKVSFKFLNFVESIYSLPSDSLYILDTLSLS